MTEPEQWRDIAATAAAWAAGAHLHDIRQGLRTFTTSYYMAPGRLNMFELDGYRVVVDYAHNPPALEALGQFVDRLTEPTAGGARAQVTGRRIGVVATAGDRRDEDIRAIGDPQDVVLGIAAVPSLAAQRDGQSIPRHASDGDTLFSAQDDRP